MIPFLRPEKNEYRKLKYFGKLVCENDSCKWTEVTEKNPFGENILRSFLKITNMKTRNILAKSSR